MSWELASFALLGGVLAVGFGWYERSRPTAKVVAMVAAMAALAALGRVAFAPLPNVKPTTDVVLLSGFALGGAPGFAVGALAAAASNLFFGQGPWTPWQMLAWGCVGVGGAALARLTGGRLPRAPMALCCAVAGLAFGAVMNFATWVQFSGDHALAKWAAISGSALPFDLAHAIGNAVFAVAFGPALVRMLTRFRRRFEVSWQPAERRPFPAGVAPALVAALVLAAGISLAATERARAASSTSYMLRAQNADGGFAASPGQRSSPLYTGWAGLGLAAAGYNPLDVRRGGRSVVDSLRADLPRLLDDTAEIERTILVLGTAGVSARSFRGVNLVGRLVARQRRSGSWSGLVNHTSFGILALRSAGYGSGSSQVRRAAGWLRAQQNRDGGFNFAGRGGFSGVDDTSGPVQALVAAGGRGSAAVRRAASFLARSQNRDGGFPLAPGGGSNAQSTAWAVQGLVAAGRNPEGLRRTRTPLGYLRSLTAPDGSVRYSRVSGQTPVWVTAQALAALARRPFPIGRVARRPGARGAGAGAAKEGTAGTRAAGAGGPVDPRLLPWIGAAQAAGVATGLLFVPL
jgi:prenyltransferase beta subunit